MDVNTTHFEIHTPLGNIRMFGYNFSELEVQPRRAMCLLRPELLLGVKIAFPNSIIFPGFWFKMTSLFPAVCRKWLSPPTSFFFGTLRQLFSKAPAHAPWNPSAANVCHITSLPRRLFELTFRISKTRIPGLVVLVVCFFAY